MLRSNSAPYCCASFVSCVKSVSSAPPYDYLTKLVFPGPILIKRDGKGKIIPPVSIFFHLLHRPAPHQFLIIPGQHRNRNLIRKRRLSSTASYVTSRRTVSARTSSAPTTLICTSTSAAQSAVCIPFAFSFVTQIPLKP